jgi:hypothetical protein
MGSVPIKGVRKNLELSFEKSDNRNLQDWMSDHLRTEPSAMDTTRDVRSQYLGSIYKATADLNA